MFTGHDAHVGEAGGTVTAGAVARISRVIYVRGFPSRHGMTGVAGLRSRHMRGWALTACQRAVVAGRAHADAGLRVVKFNDGIPLAGRFAMACITHVAGGYAELMLSRHYTDVGEPGRSMTTGAISGEAGVVYRRWFPTGDRVASVASLGGRYVRRCTLPTRQRPIVTGRTHANAGLCVIEF